MVATKPKRNKYIDYVGTWGPAIVGHADDEVLDAIKVTTTNFLQSNREYYLQTPIAVVRGVHGGASFFPPFV